MLPKIYRLDAKDFPGIYKDGRKIRGKYGMLVVKESSNPTPQFGFVVSKKIGNAVQRHRLTRMLRVIFVEIVKELNIQNKNIQYIAFEFCNESKLLKEDILKQMKEI
ncbi:MAG: ribonuclease P protein component [Candidatus Dojkabacteria bacterium]|nr:ribonuclease P protein component [Candidatus Dojkabacteria bacterium]